MEPQDQAQTNRTFIIELPDAPHLPALHINALNVRFSIDEFFCTLGVVLPPEAKPGEDSYLSDRIQAEPVFRFVVSRSVMEKFIGLLVTQYNHQTNQIQESLRAQQGQPEGVDASE